MSSRNMDADLEENGTYNFKKAVNRRFVTKTLIGFAVALVLILLFDRPSQIGGSLKKIPPVTIAPLPPDSSPTSRPKYPLGVPGKFDPDGKVQYYPGNTIISHLPQSSPLRPSMEELYNKLDASPLRHLYALLPPSSWHMTVFEGVCDDVREPGYWPSDLSINATLQECTDLFSSKLHRFDLQCEPPYKLSVKGFDPLEIGIGVHLELATPEENRRLRGLRDRLAEVLKIRHPNHETYGLHLSMAYLVRHLTAEQETQLRGMLMEHYENSMPKEFELETPEFCQFDNMFAYERLFYLHNQDN